MIRIKSITDAITNSSTEVYAYYDDDSLEKIKEFINLVITVSEGHGTVDGYFEIGFVLGENELEVAKHFWKEEYDEPFPEDDPMPFIFEWNREAWRTKGKDIIQLLPLIKAKTPEYEEQAKRLTDCIREGRKYDIFFAY